MLQRTLPAGFIAPCLATKTDKLPSGSQWLHEIKHDGFRIIARKTGAQVRLYSRPGNDLTHRFPLIVDTLARTTSTSRCSRRMWPPGTSGVKKTPTPLETPCVDSAPVFLGLPLRLDLWRAESQRG